MAIPFRRCVFGIDLRTGSEQFAGVVPFTGQSCSIAATKRWSVCRPQQAPSKPYLLGWLIPGCRCGTRSGCLWLGGRNFLGLSPEL